MEKPPNTVTVAEPLGPGGAAHAGTAAGLGLEPVRHERFAERVYDSLIHSIMTGKLVPDTRLPSEVQLASFFQVSRPVVRQALDRLRQDRLVEPYAALAPTSARARARPSRLCRSCAIRPT